MILKVTEKKASKMSDAPMVRLKLHRLETINHNLYQLHKTFNKIYMKQLTMFSSVHNTINVNYHIYPSYLDITTTFTLVT